MIAGTASAARFHQPVSYLVERLTGRAVIDHALASTSMLYGIERRGYDSALLDRFDISADELPRTGRCGGSAQGRLSAEGAATHRLARRHPCRRGHGR